MPTEDSKTVLEAVGYPNIEINTFKCQNQLELVCCKVDNPLYSVYVTVPTFIVDDKGLPHTLEHLIFCGSKGYPERGYLDRLATLCQSFGTNAYTTEDHTCYTFTSSSLNGLLNLLPVFLDHVFRPILDSEIVKTEVFYRDTDGSGKGVVYCEMSAREWTEEDQLDLALRKGIVSQMAKEMQVYGYECGGLTKHLCNLKKEEIAHYHRMYYQPQNVVVVLCGGNDLSEKIPELLKIMENVEFLAESSDPLNSDLLELCNEKMDLVKELNFPANDESLGSVGFAWAGPPSTDYYTVNALHLLLRILKDTSASPLYQYFVELAEPVASDVDYSIKPSHQSIIQLIFSGVPTECINFNGDSFCFMEKNVLKERMMEFIREWSCDDKLFRERLQICLKSFATKFQEHIEDDPHEVCASYCITDVISKRWPFFTSNSELLKVQTIGEGISTFPHIAQRLSKEPLSFWKDLLEKYILQNVSMEVIMRPSKDMNEQVKQWESENLSDIPIQKVSNKMTSFETAIPVDGLNCTIPNSIECPVTYHDSSSMVVTTKNSAMKRLNLAFDISSQVSSDLLPALVLLQELLFQSDIHVTDEIVNIVGDLKIIEPGLITYKVLVETLSTFFNTYEASVGFENELFSVGYLDSHFVLCLQGRVDFTLDQMKAIALCVLHGTLFSIERIEEVLENLINQLRDSWRDPSAVMDTLLVDRLNQGNEEIGKRAKVDRVFNVIETYVGLETQTKFLVHARDLLENDPGKLLELLDELRLSIISCPAMVSFGTNANPVDHNSSTFKSLSYSLPKYGHLENCKLSGSHDIEIIPISDITASVVSVAIPIDLCPFPSSKDREDGLEKLQCIALLCQLISYTEGPLYRRIRGSGLAYGASLTVLIWNGLLSFDINDATGPVPSLQIIFDLIHEILDECNSLLSGKLLNENSLFTVENIETAKAAQTYQFVAERSTPGSIVATAFRCQLRGLPLVGTEEETLYNQKLLSLTPHHVAKHVQKILPSFLDDQKCIKMMAVPTSRLNVIEEELVAAKFSYHINDFTKINSLLD